MSITEPAGRRLYLLLACCHRTREVEDLFVEAIAQNLDNAAFAGACSAKARELGADQQ